jgi:ATP-dependent Clp protease adaptor protein ClpS
MTQSTVKHKEKTSTRFKEPGRYNVIIYNDNITPVDFVIDILMSIFKHNGTVASELTHQIHNYESAIAGTYTYEIAEQKAIESTLIARESGYPLLVKLEIS